MLVKFNSLLVFSEKNNRSFYTEFSNGINIIKGKNTSGKSTLIQSIIYSLGINDVNEKLKEILKEQLVFRLDLEQIINNDVNPITFIREGQSFFIYQKDKNPLRFDGINSDNSTEHVKLKKTISSIFDFTLVLESKGELKEAPLEAMLLPYYISQSVGWVYLRESFSGLNYYRGFKFDYLDYYLGITTDIDRIKLYQLIKQKSDITSEIEFLDSIKNDDEKLQLSQLLDEEYKVEAIRYLNEYSELREKLAKEQTQHIDLCNKKSLAANRGIILKRIKRNISKQKPEIDTCPVCIQTLPSSLEAVYSYQQDKNDTEKEIDLIKTEMINLQSKINSASKKIYSIIDCVERRYSVVKSYLSSDSKVTFDAWLDHKSDLKLIKNIELSLADKASELQQIIDEIEKIDTDENIESIRNAREKLFLEYFQDYLSKLNVSGFEEARYNRLYKINSFPYQGVELHKTVIAYHFALNKLIGNTKGIHRFPFILDAIMKEDIDEENRGKIFGFLNEFAPDDTQMFFSVSESSLHAENDKTTTNNINIVNKKYFAEKGKIIQIGDGNSERSLLTDQHGRHDKLVQSTLEMMDIT